MMAMAKWEYADLSAWRGRQRTVYWDGPDGQWSKEADFVEQLNQAGQQGWEAVGYATTIWYNTDGVSCLLKRPLP
jgi:hypothetical protein